MTVFAENNIRPIIPLPVFCVMYAHKDGTIYQSEAMNLPKAKSVMRMYNSDPDCFKAGILRLAPGYDY